MKLAIILLSIAGMAGAAQTAPNTQQPKQNHRRTVKRHRARSKARTNRTGEADRRDTRKAAPEVNPLDPVNPDPMRPEATPNDNPDRLHDPSRPTTVPPQKIA